MQPFPSEELSIKEFFGRFGGLEIWGKGHIADVCGLAVTTYTSFS
jgi:hypothetical protein